ncbi:two-component system sensor histidine kinase [Paenibacillus sp. 32O-W]|uniref:sensor histidine kinase n=1 Tax=Paenibacillus sp. 32O-W TaxID=1695218 RepID=UPI000720C175|nr:HAMP domain-containing sensor histidine kinase [Paenibacillus sp. 32O-W]ALS25917.1 two-component system sensor histidine kinase [Paenibacillus sp. 32O-W]
MSGRLRSLFGRLKLKHSLLNQYLLIILLAIVLVPVMFPLSITAVYLFMPPEDLGGEEIYQFGAEMEKMWHNEARQLDGASAEEIDARLIRLKEKYEEASMYWVDGQGRTRLRLPDTLDVPERWTPAFTVRFMKERYDGDPFTVVAFIGGKEEAGFMVFELPRSEMTTRGQQIWEKRDTVLIMTTLSVIVLFLFVSWIFFYRIRRRLLRLQQAMTQPSPHGIPSPTVVHKPDEIGKLEQAFNTMIGELEAGRRREREEERLRRSLIANLSHDLRTPLTAIRGHVYSLQEEPLSEKGRQSLALIDRKVGYLGQLIDNLMSYTLLAAGKYPYRPERTDMVRLLRTVCANWYPAFENEGFEIELELPERGFAWEVDPAWFERVMDNLLQNVLRHAKTGNYLAVRAYRQDGAGVIELEDRGPGMNGVSGDKGAGIGLTIVALMLKEMKLDWDIISGSGGTVIRIRGLIQI